MSDDVGTALFDSDIASHLVRIIDESKERLILVFPYWSIGKWRHLSSALTRCAQRSVKIMSFLRDEPEQSNGEGAEFLRGIGAQVYLVPGLHAKIYLNEMGGLVSSMNLTEPSTRNSFEVGIQLNAQQVQSVNEYIRTRLIPTARPLNKVVAEVSVASRSRTTARRQPRARPTGHCVRCGTSLSFDPDRPLCDECYGVWSQWSDPDYPEKLCHHCGREERVSYGRPLCRTCYQTR